MAGFEHDANQLLSVCVGDQDFALDVMKVREIRGWVGSTALPHAPSFVKGMVNLRGVVVPIISLAERLGLLAENPTSSSVVVVIEAKACVVGLLVDAVSDIITVGQDQVQTPPDVGSASSQGLVSGLITLQDRIVSIVSIANILPEGCLTQPLAA